MMRLRKHLLFMLSLLTVVALLPTTLTPRFLPRAYASILATSPVLGDAASYLVLAGSIVANTGPTTVAGDLGVSPSIGVPPHVTGFPPGLVLAPGTIHDADANAAAAQADNTTAFGTLDQSCDVTYAGVQDLTLVSPLGPGVYCASGFALSGNLTLSGSGVWIFKSASTVITAPGSSVTGGDACNVWWRVGSSATLDTATTFIGNVLALTSITLNTGASLNGRALAQTGAVTMADNAISLICAEVPPTATPTDTATPTLVPPTATPTDTATPTPTGTPPTATPTNTATPTLVPPTATPTSTPTLAPTNDDDADEPALQNPIYLPAIRG